MQTVTLIFMPICEEHKTTASSPTSYVVVLPGAGPHGLQSPRRYQTIDDLCEHITEQLRPGESFDLEGLRTALSRREKYAVLVDIELAGRVASLKRPA